MKEDVGTTKREPLKGAKRLALFEREKGICCICTTKIFGSFIDEHKRALGLGGSNAPENRGVAHPNCAAAKTLYEDMPRINKAKRQKRKQHGIKKPAKGPPLKGRGFETPAKTGKMGSKEATIRALRVADFVRGQRGK